MYTCMHKTKQLNWNSLHVQVKYIHEGSEECELFFQLLLDEPEQQEVALNQATATQPSQGGGTDLSSSQSQYGLAQFLDHVRGEVLKSLN